MKHFKLIACKLLQRELSAVAVGSEHYTDITFIRQELPQDSKAPEGEQPQ